MNGKMKAYKAWDSSNTENGTTIVFAENAKEAKKYALLSDVCEDADFLDVRVRRYKEADGLYKGQREVEWYDDETRLKLVRDFGWQCGDPDYAECKTCVARAYCGEVRDWIDQKCSDCQYADTCAITDDGFACDEFLEKE